MPAAIVEDYLLDVHEQVTLSSAAQQPDLAAVEPEVDPTTPFTDPVPEQPVLPPGVQWDRRPAFTRRGPERATDLLAMPAPVRDWVLPGLLVRCDRVLLVDPDPLRGTLLTWQLAAQAAIGLHPITLQPVKPVRVLLVDHQAPEDTLLRLLCGFRRAARQPLDNLWVVAGCRRVEIPQPDDGKAWRRLIDSQRPDLVVTSVEVPKNLIGFSVVRLAALRSVSKGRSLDWKESPALREAGLVFRLSTQADRPGVRLRREKGQLADRPSWPATLHYRRRALEEGRWPWSVRKPEPPDSKAVASRPDPGWDLLAAHVRQLGRRPTQRELADVLRISLGTVNAIIQRHRSEYEALVDA